MLDQACIVRVLAGHLKGFNISRGSDTVNQALDKVYFIVPEARLDNFF